MANRPGLPHAPREPAASRFDLSTWLTHSISKSFRVFLFCKRTRINRMTKSPRHFNWSGHILYKAALPLAVVNSIFRCTIQQLSRCKAIARISLAADNRGLLMVLAAKKFDHLATERVRHLQLDDSRMRCVKPWRDDHDHGYSMMPNQKKSKHFWSEVFALRGSVTLQVLPRVMIFGTIAAVIWTANEWTHELDFHLAVAPYEVAGAVLGLLLVLRTNAGYDRWWEARKLWGGIVNQSRNLAISGLVYGPTDPAWRAQFVKWASAFPHVARHSLRGERDLPKVVGLLGDKEAATIAAAEHMPSFVALQLAQLLAQAVHQGGMDRWAFQQVDTERANLIDHLGGCERILKSPLPRMYSIKIRRFIFLFLVALPFALLDKVGVLTPLVTMFVAYPILALDQAGYELQQPFSMTHLGHLPLDEISETIETNLDHLLPALHASARQADAKQPTP